MEHMRRRRAILERLPSPTGGLTGYSVTSSLDRRQQYGAIGGAVLMFGAQSLLQWKAQDYRDDAMARIRGSLDKRLFQ